MLILLLLLLLSYSTITIISIIIYYYYYYYHDHHTAVLYSCTLYYIIQFIFYCWIIAVYILLLLLSLFLSRACAYKFFCCFFLVILFCQHLGRTVFGKMETCRPTCFHVNVQIMRRNCKHQLLVLCVTASKETYMVWPINVLSIYIYSLIWCGLLMSTSSRFFTSFFIMYARGAIYYWQWRSSGEYAPSPNSTCNWCRIRLSVHRCDLHHVQAPSLIRHSNGLIYRVRCRMRWLQ